LELVIVIAVDEDDLVGIIGELAGQVNAGETGSYNNDAG
jgi:hypothetical protein